MQAQCRQKRASILIAMIAVFLACTFFAVTTTVAADPAVAPYAAALAVLFLALLILLRRIDPAKAKDGVLAATLSLLPDILAWSRAGPARAGAMIFVLLVASYGVIWLGPQGVANVTVACDDAKEVAFSFDDPDTRTGCAGALTRAKWLMPQRRLDPIVLRCFDESDLSWAATPQRGAYKCGSKPKAARFIRPGVPFLADGSLLREFEPETSVEARMIDGLARIADGMAALDLPDRRFPDIVLFATWNIRNLGENRYGLGERLPESYAYIAQVISHFDIVSVQELNDISGLMPIMAHLGDNYRAEFGQYAPGAAGNRERLGFIYDTRKVRLGDVSTTLVFDARDFKSLPNGQPARPPFMAQFKVNGRSFYITTAHTYFGSNQGELFKRRVDELSAVSRGLERLAQRFLGDAPLILAGDLNVSSYDGEEIEALTENNFSAPDALIAMPTNPNVTRPYSQILLRGVNRQQIIFSHYGIVRVFDWVFREEDANSYAPDFIRIAPEKAKPDDPKSYTLMRSFQISDQLPKWVAFRADWEMPVSK